MRRSRYTGCVANRRRPKAFIARTRYRPAPDTSTKHAAGFVSASPSFEPSATIAVGFMVDAVSSANPSAVPHKGPDGGPRDERRQLTVFFCDLVASTSLSEALDPEDLAD